MKRRLLSLSALLASLAVSACPRAAAADLSCAQQVGPKLAAQLARECRQVSAATHPPCNAANACAMVIDEIERGCETPRDGAQSPVFCLPAERAGTFQGYLFSGGGSDADFLSVLTDTGERVSAYCVQQCDKLFATDANDIAYLRREMVGRRVALVVAIERNGGRIPGPDDDDRIPMVKRLTLLK